jgi:hypothetical protein
MEIDHQREISEAQESDVSERNRFSQKQLRAVLGSPRIVPPQKDLEQEERPGGCIVLPLLLRTPSHVETHTINRRLAAADLELDQRPDKLRAGYLFVKTKRAIAHNREIEERRGFFEPGRSCEKKRQVPSGTGRGERIAPPDRTIKDLPQEIFGGADVTAAPEHGRPIDLQFERDGCMRESLK